MSKGEPKRKAPRVVWLYISSWGNVSGIWALGGRPRPCLGQLGETRHRYVLAKHNASARTGKAAKQEVKRTASSAHPKRGRGKVRK